VLVKKTVSGTVPETALGVKDATGAGARTVMVELASVLVVPSLAVSVTVKVPGVVKV
jgi:hypothetical protein